MLIINSGGLIGDCISGIPITLTLSGFAIKPAKVFFANEQVASLLPRDANLELISGDEMEVLRGSHNPVYELNNSKTFMTYHATAHMTQAHYLYHGLKDPGGPVRPKIEYDTEGLPVFDYIVSPFSRSNSPDNNKFWAIENWIEVFKFLGKERNPNGHLDICLVGSSDDPHLDVNLGEYDVSIHYFYNQPLRKVAGLISKARNGVLSVDNGISHLTYAVGAKHFLIYPKCLPLVWVCNPDATIIQGNPPDILVESVISLL